MYSVHDNIYIYIYTVYIYIYIYIYITQYVILNIYYPVYTHTHRYLHWVISLITCVFKSFNVKRSSSSLQP